MAGCGAGSTSSHLTHRLGRLLVVEVKTELRDIGALQRQVGWYRQAAVGVARAAGWSVRSTVVVVIFLATDANDTCPRREPTPQSAPPSRLRGRAVRDLLVERALPPGEPGWGLVMIDPMRRGDRVLGCDAPRWAKVGGTLPLLRRLHDERPKSPMKRTQDRRGSVHAVGSAAPSRPVSPARVAPLHPTVLTLPGQLAVREATSSTASRRSANSADAGAGCVAGCANRADTG